MTSEYINALGKNWHDECFACPKCIKGLHGKGFVSHEGKGYHSECYSEAVKFKCVHCQGIINATDQHFLIQDEVFI